MELNLNYLALRRILGISGLALPFLLWISNGFQIEPSLSDYYYTPSSVLFTGTLIAFGLFLIAYRGYPREDDRISDNIITNAGGLMALLTALLPTGCDCYAQALIYAHQDTLRSTLHIIFAGLFLFSMGWMALFKFTRSPQSGPVHLRRKTIYRITGAGIWLIIVYLILGFAFGFNLTGIDVLIGEVMALWLFGTSWMVKGRAFASLGL